VTVWPGKPGPATGSRATVGIGLLAAELLAMVAFAFQPAGPLASIVAGALAATGLGWLSRRRE